MRKVIVVEGPDGAGKSTLCKELSKELGWPVHHTGGPIYTKEDFWARVYSLNFENVILDRHPGVSQVCYGFLGWDGITQADGREALRFADPAVVIYCRRKSVDDMLNSIVTSTKAHKPAEYLERVQRTYPRIVEKYDSAFSWIPHVPYDYEQPLAFARLLVQVYARLLYKEIS